MKKVAIITFHRALNYGAKFQAFALQEAIAQSHDAKILDYRCKSIEDFYYRSNIVKKIAKWMVFPKLSWCLAKREKKFLSFDKKYYRLSSAYHPNDVHRANLEFDLFVSGSDQVWNPIITGNDLNFFLAFAEKGKACTYAVSLGKTTTADLERLSVKPFLLQLNNVSLREKSSVTTIKNYVDEIESYSVLDPVFLLSKQQWISKIGLKEHQENEKYIFIYIVAKQTNLIDKAKRIARENNWKIYYIDALRYKDPEIFPKNDIGPVEFLELLLNAELVMTTSFHAFALSLIFNKSFLYELSKEVKNANSRLTDIAEELELSEFEIVDAESKYSSNYNWDDINKRIEIMKGKSLKTLFDSLK